MKLYFNFIQYIKLVFSLPIWFWILSDFKRIDLNESR